MAKTNSKTNPKFSKRHRERMTQELKDVRKILKRRYDDYLKTREKQIDTIKREHVQEKKENEKRLESTWKNLVSSAKKMEIRKKAKRGVSKIKSALDRMYAFVMDNRKDDDDNDKRTPLLQSDPGFLEKINRRIQKDLKGRLRVQCTDESKILIRNKVKKLEPALMGYQRVVQYATDPRNVINPRLALIFRTGSGKTVSMILTLTNYWEDPRAKVLIFPNSNQKRNFYVELCQWQNPYLDFVTKKIGYPKYDSTGTMDSEWYEKMVNILRMKGRMSRAGKPGEMAAPLRCYTYTTAYGKAVRTGKDPFFKRPKGTNPFSNKICLIDEAHNLLKWKEIPHPVAKKNLQALGPILMTCKDTVFLAMTATPIVKQAIEGKYLLRIVKGGNPRLKNAHHIIYFNSTPRPVYPPVAINLKNEVQVMPIYLRGTSLLHALSKAPAGMRDLNMVTTDFHMKRKFTADMEQMIKYAQKLVTIAMLIKKSKKRYLVMIERTQGIRTLHRILQSALNTKVGLLYDSSEHKKKGAKFCEKMRAAELGWFNGDPNSNKVIVADAKQFAEGVSFYGCVQLCIVNPPSSYSALKQMYGRVLRACRSNCRSPINIFLCIAKSIDGATADEKQLERIKLQRNDIEPAMEALCGSSIASRQLRSEMGLRNSVITKDMVEKSLSKMSLYEWLKSFVVTAPPKEDPFKDFFMSFEPTKKTDKFSKTQFLDLLCKYLTDRKLSKKHTEFAEARLRKEKFPCKALPTLTRTSKKAVKKS